MVALTTGINWTRYHSCSHFACEMDHKLEIVRLSRLSGRALVAQDIGVLGLTPNNCWPFHFPLLSPHNILFSFIFSMRENALGNMYICQLGIKYIHDVMLKLNYIV